MPDDISYFRRLRERRQRFLDHLCFLLSCKKKKLIPKFIKIRCSVPSSPRLRKTLSRMHFIVLRCVIRDTRSKLAYIESLLYNLHLLVANKLPPEDWTDLDRKSFHETQKLSVQRIRVHSSKIAALKCGRPVATCPALSQTQQALLNNPKVLNISDSVIPPESLTTLSLGLDFSIKSKKSDNLNIVANVEKSFRHSQISKDQKDFLRHQLVDAMSFNSNQKCNLSREELADLKSLRSNHELIITPADKGNTIVILSSGQYRQGLQDLLCSNVYSACKKSTLEDSMKAVKLAVRSSTMLDNVRKRSLLPSYYQPGRLYISPKIHKPALAFRPILSSINTPAYLLSKYMAKQLSFLFPLNPFSISNTADFIQGLQHHQGQDLIMVSFDVKSMFTCIPVPAAIAALASRLNSLHYTEQNIDSIIKLVEVCTRPPVFSVQNKLYTQVTGLPMGGSLSPILCDLYMWNIEERLHTLPCQPTMWTRYVDDVFSLFRAPKEVIADVLTHLNQLDPFVQFTVDVEEDNFLPFLDVAVTRTDQSFLTTVYRKPFAVSLPPHRRSAHPFSQKMSAFAYYVKRAFTVCSDTDKLTDELNFLQHIALDRGYPPSIISSLVRKQQSKLQHPSYVSTLTRIPDTKISLPWLILPQSNFNITKVATVCRHTFRCVFKPDFRISSYLHAPKDVPQEFDRPGVYYIPCECGLGYVGQTCRALRYRLSEHKTNVKFCKIHSSNLASHAWEFSHNFKFPNTTLLKCTSDSHVLNTFESAYILHNQNRLVNDQYFPHLSNIWLSVDHQLQTLPPNVISTREDQENNVILPRVQTSSSSST